MKNLAIRICALPSICDSTNFGLDEPDKNRALLKQILAKPKTEEYEFPSLVHDFFRTGNWQTGGYIVLMDISENLINYLVKYEKPQKIEGCIRPVVQTCVWKTIDWTTSHLAERVFFDILLENCGCIMSDKEQTPDGKKFWQNMMSIADHKGYKISFVSKNKIVSVKAPNQTMRDWIDSFNTWGIESKYQLERFLISKG